MSRTIRRNKKESILRWCGTIEDVDHWDRRRYPGRDDRQTYAKRVHWYTRDHHSGMFNAPRWWRSMIFTRPERCHAKHVLHRHLATGEWDDHINPVTPRQAKWRWQW